MTTKDFDKNMKPDVRVVDPETGKLGYFYTPQQLEWYLEQQKINRWMPQVIRDNSRHPLAGSGVWGSGGFQHTNHATHAC